jgi:hypothetical protein
MLDGLVIVIDLIQRKHYAFLSNVAKCSLVICSCLSVLFSRRQFLTTGRSDILPVVPGVNGGGPAAGHSQPRGTLANGAARAALATPPTAGAPGRKEGRAGRRQQQPQQQQQFRQL